jgi:hypothetical protein
MSKADYYRPARYQINTVARCGSCGQEREYPSAQQVDGSPCFCGGTLRAVGESYPASSDDWDEERDSVNGPWRTRR